MMVDDVGKIASGRSETASYDEAKRRMSGDGRAPKSKLRRKGNEIVIAI